MAKRKTRAKQQKRNWRDSPWLKGEVVGGALVALSIILLLSLVAPGRSGLVGSLVNALFGAFGFGLWLVPPLLAAFGAWLVAREVAEQSPAWGRRLLGGLGLLASIEGLLHIVSGQPVPGAPGSPGPEAAGGLMGLLLGEAAVTIFGADIGSFVLAVGVIVAGMALLGITWAQVRTAATAAWQTLTGKNAGASERGWITPPLPLGHTERPWERWWRKLTGAGNPGLPSGPSTLRLPEDRMPQRSPAPARGQAARNGAAPAPTGNVSPPGPRIIGNSGQTWRLPPVSEMLEDMGEQEIKSEDLRYRAQIIEKTLEGFGVPVKVVEANQGPAVTQFGLKPGVIVRKNYRGEETQVKVRVAQIQKLSNDLALALAASPIRIEAPVPGRDVVGVEVPNVQISMVSLRGVMESDEYHATRGPLVFGLGRDVSGQAAAADMTRMPHLLIAGATGSGKSVCVNAIVTALLLSHTPETLRFLMIDPKRVELTVYNGIPHLIAPVVVDVERAVPVLQWATNEMERRYKLFAKMGARNIESYNEKLRAKGEQILPFIVIFIDELADLMLSAPEDVERHICRIAQMARATGIHLVIATQRPSVDVVTGLIKANFPSRIAFAVTSQIDSRVILDTPGAEQLLGRGDMLYMAPDTSKLQRLQGCFVSDRETQRIVRYWTGVRTLMPEGREGVDWGAESSSAGDAEAGPPEDGAANNPPWLPGQEMLQQPLWTDMANAERGSGDDLYRQAVEEVRRTGRASVSLLQRRLRIGYSRAARLIDEMEENGVVGPDQGGTRGREVLPLPGKDHESLGR